MTNQTQTEVKIQIPEGMEIDEANSTYEHIKFKPLTPTWNTLKSISGFYTDETSDINYVSEYRTVSHNVNIFPTREDAESTLALAQLLQLRKAVIGDWTPNWNSKHLTKYTIIRTNNYINLNDVNSRYDPLSFPTSTMRNLFADTHVELLNRYFQIT